MDTFTLVFYKTQFLYYTTLQVFYKDTFKRTLYIAVAFSNFNNQCNKYHDYTLFHEYIRNKLNSLIFKTWQNVELYIFRIINDKYWQRIGKGSVN